MKESKYRAVTKLLRSRILRGVYEGRMPAEVTLAKDLSVSTATIEQSLAQLETMGLIERRWRSGTFTVPSEKRPKTLSVLLSSASVHPEVMQAFGRAAQARGLDLVLATHESAEVDQVINEILGHLGNPTCVGACLFAFAMDADRALRLTKAPAPVVVADWESPDLVLPTINYDNRGVGHLAAGHLLMLGHRRIALVDPLMPFSTRTVRTEAAIDLVRRNGGSFRDLHGPDFGWKAPPCVALLREPDRPTGVICSSQNTALDMAEAAKSLGMNVPGDVSILCLGNLVHRQEQNLFTNIEFDPAALGAGAFDLLLESTTGGEPRNVLVPVRLIDRGSTAPPPTERK
jgi:LacI family transcriptional regulator